MRGAELGGRLFALMRQPDASSARVLGVGLAAQHSEIDSLRDQTRGPWLIHTDLPRNIAHAHGMLGGGQSLHEAPKRGPPGRRIPGFVLVTHEPGPFAPIRVSVVTRLSARPNAAFTPAIPRRAAHTSAAVTMLATVASLAAASPLAPPRTTSHAYLREGCSDQIFGALFVHATSIHLHAT